MVKGVKSEPVEPDVPEEEEEDGDYEIGEGPAVSIAGAERRPICNALNGDPLC